MASNPLNALAQDGEPALNTSRAVALVAAIIAVVVAFGIPLDTEKQLAIVGLVTVAAPLVQGYLTRRKVVPADEVAVQVPTGTDVLVAGPALPLVADGTEVTVTTT